MNASPSTVSSAHALRVHQVSKAYRIWKSPDARLKHPLAKVLGSYLPEAITPSALARRIEPGGYFRDFYALREIDLTIERGEAVGIIGRNGSGKSTLLQIIAGTLQPTSGSVEVHGRVAALLELGSGFNPEFTGRENIFLNAAILGLTQAETAARIDDIIAFADIGPFIDEPVRTYSSGMAVRLAFSTQIAIDPAVLIVDEALSVGDESFQRKCFRRIESLRSNGCTILFVSHDAGSVIKLCDRAVMLQHGRKFAEGRPKSVVTVYQKSLADGAASPDRLLEDFAKLERAPVTPAPAEHRAISLAKTDSDESYLDPSLASTTSVDYTNDGAALSGFSILNANGRPVNVLQSGKNYTFRYDVELLRDATDVAFGCMFKGLTGLELCGANSRIGLQESLHPGPGQRFEVRFEFTCHLLSGTYALNAGVIATENGEEIYLARRVDALLFRVSDDIGLLSRGLVGLVNSVCVKSS